jgi:uncharacterized protein
MSNETNASQGHAINFKQGDICHLELPVKDKERAKSFYGEIFGWKFQDAHEMNYTLFSTPGNVIGGGLFTPSERMPDKVINYLTVESIDRTAPLVAKYGGKTLSPKIEVSGHGSMMHLLDSEGNLIALWEPTKK